MCVARRKVTTLLKSRAFAARATGEKLMRAAHLSVHALNFACKLHRFSSSRAVAALQQKELFCVRIRKARPRIERWGQWDG